MILKLETNMEKAGETEAAVLGQLVRSMSKLIEIETATNAATTPRQSKQSRRRKSPSGDSRTVNAAQPKSGQLRRMERMAPRRRRAARETSEAMCRHGTRDRKPMPIFLPTVNQY